MAKEQTFNSNQSKVKLSEVNALSGSKFIGATFLYLTLALLVTFAVVGGLGTLIQFNEEAILGNVETYLAIYIVSIIAYIPVLIWVHIAARRNGKSVGVGFFVYSILMGVLISPACLAVNIGTLLVSLGSTILAFAVMALIAWTSKRDMSKLAIIGFGMLVGALFLSLFNFIFYLIAPGVYVLTYALISVVFFVAIILLTIVDLKHVQQIAMNGGAERNIAFICALNLYVDFIYIFIRLLRIVALIMGNRR